MFEDQIDEHLGTPTIIAVSLILGGLLLGVRRPGAGRPQGRGLRTSATPSSSAPPRRWRSTRARRGRGSRSRPAGSSGFDRDAAARISFLMMIPVTAGAVVFKMAGLAGDGIPDGLAVPMIVGIVTSGDLRLVRGVGHCCGSCARTASCRS